MMGYGHGFFGYGNMMGGGLLGGLFALITWGLLLTALVLAVVWAVRTLSGQHDANQSPPPPAVGSGPDEAVSIARKRLATGEITPEEFEQIMTRLGGSVN